MNLPENRLLCTGCGACADACPAGAIGWEEDSFGVRFPLVDRETCCECGKCRRVCPIGKAQDFTFAPLACYAGVSESTDILQSSSGGIFAALAQRILSQGGAAVGAVMTQTDGVLSVRHALVQQERQLPALYGSKYVQSDTAGIYAETQSLLQQGKTVLFSGTPCQVAALRSFLRRDWENLYCADIICHGVPPVRMFQDWIAFLQKKFGGVITSFAFRDKSVGWGLAVRASVERNGKTENRYFAAEASSYYGAFLGGETYRESCYSCPYAAKYRPGDITLGDYWGIAQQHPEILAENGGFVHRKKGCSCILVNTEKGKRLLELADSDIRTSLSDFDRIAACNGQLKAPSVKGKNRDALLVTYGAEGFEAFDSLYSRLKKKQIQIARLKFAVKRILFRRGA